MNDSTLSNLSSSLTNLRQYKKVSHCQVPFLSTHIRTTFTSHSVKSPSLTSFVTRGSCLSFSFSCKTKRDILVDSDDNDTGR